MQAKNANLSILIVDDDAMVRSIMVEYLQNMGFKNITAAEDGNDALTHIFNEKFKIDLIISDWEMPEVTGLSLLKAVRNNQKRAEVPFILVTSQRSMERFKISQAAQWQVSAYVLKPFRQETLRLKIWEVLSWNDDKVA